MAHIKVYYSTWTEEDLEFGETDNKGEFGFISCVPDQWDTEDGYDEVYLAVQELRRAGAFEPSASFFHTGVWYTACEDEYRTGEHTDYTYHLEGFTEVQEQTVFNSITSK